MKLSDFSFDLPDELIARYPAEQRDASRLLHVYDNHFNDKIFTDLVDLLSPDDCLIFNNTKVIAARLLGQRESGGKVEVLMERLIDECEFVALVKSSNALPLGARLLFGEYQIEVTGREGMFYRLRTGDQIHVFDVLEKEGHIPLPPYIDRADTDIDIDRYQTVYAKEQGAVAAPTAGLHFTDALFSKLQQKGIRWEFVTLHVGSGTFAPVRVDDIENHTMHSEWFRVPKAAADLVNQTRAQGGRVVAVGTTSVRSLESANYQQQNGHLAILPTTGDTNIFIYPGYQFRFVDALITNFHLPQSTLIMLVSALMGRETIMRAYEHAVKKKYRFFSYGDAMLLERAV